MRFSSLALLACVAAAAVAGGAAFNDDKKKQFHQHKKQGGNVVVPTPTPDVPKPTVTVAEKADVCCVHVGFNLDVSASMSDPERATYGAEVVKSLEAAAKAEGITRVYYSFSLFAEKGKLVEKEKKLDVAKFEPGADHQALKSRVSSLMQVKLGKWTNHDVALHYIKAQHLAARKQQPTCQHLMVSVGDLETLRSGSDRMMEPSTPVSIVGVNAARDVKEAGATLGFVQVGDAKAEHIAAINGEEGSSFMRSFNAHRLDGRTVSLPGKDEGKILAFGRHAASLQRQLDRILQCSHKSGRNKQFCAQMDKKLLVKGKKKLAALNRELNVARHVSERCLRVLAFDGKYQKLVALATQTGGSALLEKAAASAGVGAAFSALVTRLNLKCDPYKFECDVHLIVVFDMSRSMIVDGTNKAIKQLLQESIPAHLKDSRVAVSVYFYADHLGTVTPEPLLVDGSFAAHFDKLGFGVTNAKEEPVSEVSKAVETFADLPGELPGTGAKLQPSQRWPALGGGVQTVREAMQWEWESHTMHPDRFGPNGEPVPRYTRTLQNDEHLIQRTVPYWRGVTPVGEATEFGGDEPLREVAGFRVIRDKTLMGMGLRAAAAHAAKHNVGGKKRVLLHITDGYPYDAEKKCILARRKVKAESPGGSGKMTWDQCNILVGACCSEKEACDLLGAAKAVEIPLFHIFANGFQLNSVLKKELAAWNVEWQAKHAEKREAVFSAPKSIAELPATFGGAVDSMMAQCPDVLKSNVVQTATTSTATTQKRFQ